jgi:thiol-disulfide isomerase/thioredoxin
VAAGLVAVLILAAVGVVAAGTFDDDRPSGSADHLRDPGGDPDAPDAISTDGPTPGDSFEYWDGGEGSLSDFAGTPVVLNFFASWCAPCVAEMPDFEQVHQEIGDQVRFVGVNETDDRQAAEGIIERTGITYEVVRDSGPLLEGLEGLVMPTTVLITADGRVVRLHSGPMDADQLRTAIDEELLA